VSDDLYSRTLVRAARIVGGEAELALRLNISASILDLWIMGRVVPPTEVFLKAVDIVMERDQDITAPWLPSKSESLPPERKA
jgi:hypothetical protein